MESDLIRSDWNRCINDKCPLRNNCKRFLQSEIDARNNRILVTGAYYEPDMNKKCSRQLPLNHQSKF